MQRYFANKIEGNYILLDDKDYHHIKNVMRMHAGDKIECVINQYLYLCEVDNDYKVKIISKKEQRNDKYPDIILIIPALKEQKMDLIFQLLLKLWRLCVLAKTLTI